MGNKLSLLKKNVWRTKTIKKANRTAKERGVWVANWSNLVSYINNNTIRTRAWDLATEQIGVMST